MASRRSNYSRSHHVRRIMLFIVYDRIILGWKSSIAQHTVMVPFDSLVRVQVWLTGGEVRLTHGTRIVHIITMSIICHEENLRRKQVAKQKNIELEDRVLDNLERRATNSQ